MENFILQCKLKVTFSYMNDKREHAVILIKKKLTNFTYEM